MLKLFCWYNIKGTIFLNAENPLEIQPYFYYFTFLEYSNLTTKFNNLTTNLTTKHFCFRYILKAMAKIVDLPDFSQFVQKVDGIKVHNTVNFVIGEKTIEANGIVISQKSTILLDLAVKNSDIYLDDFVNDLNGVQDCLELL